MNIGEFLDVVLPHTGYIMLATPYPTGGFEHVALEDFAGVARVAGQWRKANKPVFFAMATFERRRIWNKQKKDRNGAIKPGYEYRTQRNALLVKSLFLDIDIKDEDGRHPTYAAALAALKTLCSKVGIDRPMIVATGGGLHCYWPLAEAVKPDEWRPVAEKFKAITMALDIRADSNITADCARVLRLPGSMNIKYDPPRKVERKTLPPQAMPLAHYDRLFSRFIADEGVPLAKRRAPPGLTLPAGIPDNLGATNEPANLNGIVFGCPFMQQQVATRGSKATEPQWRMALGIARFCEPQHPAMLAVSDAYPGFTDDEMRVKMANWSGGPSTCAKIHDVHTDAGLHSECPSCVHWNKITTPLQLGREIVEAQPVTVQLETDTGGSTQVTLPPPPDPYRRRTLADGAVHIVIESEDADQRKTYATICPYDFYPVRILRQTGDDVNERSVWRMHLSRMDATDLVISQELVTDVRKLHAWAVAKGMYINPEHAKALQVYMTAYLRKLSEEIDRAKVYERLGWHDSHQTFVMPERIYHRDGQLVGHDPTSNLRKTTKDAYRAAGAFQKWFDAMKFYGGAGMEQYRSVVYGSFAAPLFHMTGYKGVLVGATGETGRGKTTALEAAASVWGEPDAQKISGSKQGATTNALYNHISTLHSLPMIWDETTQREADEMREFLLDISQGKGKERMKGNEHDGKVMTWETMVLSSANTDDVQRILASGNDSNPHLMRLVSIEFTNVDVSTTMKHRADDFRAAIHENYGHAGPAFIRYVTENYEAVKARVTAIGRQLEVELKAESHERYWSATMACMIVGGEIAFRLGLLPFSPKTDVAWLKAHMTRMRESIADAQMSAENLLVDFLNAATNNTLILTLYAANLGNIAREPHGPMLVRHEADVGIIYISRAALAEWCEKRRVNMRRMAAVLTKTGVLISANVQKVLGADTVLAKGQTRCWKVDDSNLGVIRQQVQQIVQQSGNIVNLPTRKVKP